MSEQKNTTIEDLAIMIQGGFTELRTEMNERFDEVDKRFERVETDVSEIKTDIVGIKQRLIGLENRLDTFVDHERRLTKVETVLKLQSS